LGLLSGTWEVFNSTALKKWEWLFVSGLQMQDPDFYCDRIFKLMPRWDKCIDMLGDYFG
jgi:hypothetical protein